MAVLNTLYTRPILPFARGRIVASEHRAGVAFLTGW